MSQLLLSALKIHPAAYDLTKNYGIVAWIHSLCYKRYVRACLQGERVTLASGLTLAGGQKVARFHKKNFTGRVTLQPGTTYCAVTLKGSGNNQKVNPGRRVNPTRSVYKAKR